MSQALRDARRYEEVMSAEISGIERPAFHLSPRTGWMNDPNGFSYYQGFYHLFYQYHPYDTRWGPMHWGHAVSRDLLHWQYKPVALAPDAPYDYMGVFSGSAEMLGDGRQLLMYTGVKGVDDPLHNIKPEQIQCIAFGNGEEYDKYEGNPVLTKKDLPEGLSSADFRDPKIWREVDGTYRVVIGACTADKDGRILMYKSKDGFKWEFVRVIAENNHRYGRMWECPDYFELDGRQVLLTSPQDMLPEGFEYHNGNGTLCLVGTRDSEDESFTEICNQAIDYGIDYYATQTILTPDGRRVMIAWMQNWDTCGNVDENAKWFGQMSLPRELHIIRDRLYQLPVRELISLRHHPVKVDNLQVSDMIDIEGIKGRMVDMELTIRPKDPERMYRKFAVYFAKNDRFRTSLSYHPQDSVLKIDRKFSDSRRAVIHQRRCQVPFSNGELKLRMILDRYSVEIFVNDGEYVMSATIYTELDADGISFFADGDVCMDLIKYSLTQE